MLAIILYFTITTLILITFMRSARAWQKLEFGNKLRTLSWSALFELRHGDKLTDEGLEMVKFEIERRKSWKS